MLIDTREKGKIVKNLLDSCNSELRTLDAGDYYIPLENGGVVIERMTYSDFCGKIMSGRLWTQIEKCRSLSNIVYVILENIYTLKYSKISQSSYLGVLLSMYKMDLRVVNSRNMSETTQIIKKLYEYFEVGRKVSHSEIRVKPKSMSSKNTAIFMLMGVQGVGEKTAKKALKDRTLYEYFTYLMESKSLSKTEDKIKKCLIG